MYTSFNYMLLYYYEQNQILDLIFSGSCVGRCNIKVVQRRSFSERENAVSRPNEKIH